MAKRKFTIDAGKNKVKFAITDERGIITHIGAFDSMSQGGFSNFNTVFAEGDYQFKVEFEGKKYLVGNEANTIYNVENTKRNEHHKLCIYTALGYFCENGEEISLVTGCPTSDYAQTEEPEIFGEFLRDNSKEISIIINGEKKSFKIKNVQVETEGMAIIPRNLLSKNTDEQQRANGYRVIDIGGQQLNYRDYDKNGNSHDSFSLDDAGINHLEQKLRREFRKATSSDKIDMKSLDFKKYMKTGYIDIPDLGELKGYQDSKDFMTSVINEFIQKQIIENLQSNGVNILGKGKKNIFTGGGSVTLEKYISGTFENNINNVFFSKTAYWDNCFSYIFKSFLDTDVKGMTQDQILEYINNIFSQAKNPNLEKEKDALKVLKASKLATNGVNISV